MSSLLSREPLLTTDLPGLTPYSRGKVRDIYDLGDRLLIVTTDRISAFDAVLPTGIPGKGTILNLLSAFWFRQTRSILRNHLITADFAAFPASLSAFGEQLIGRSMIVRKAERADVECVVRGYLAGSAWLEYRRHGTVCGENLPSGLRESEQLPRPIFTPSTKAETGHDQNISRDRLHDLVGAPLAKQLEEKSLAVYAFADDLARRRGIIVADTKMEFGFVDDELCLIDELLTPDSSRFWDQSGYLVSSSQPSFDKQFVRDWLEQIGWNKEPPAPALPEDVVTKTASKYLEAYRRLVG
ncbi:MAG: phosphoribosylaminoimidazolesuccinocarboxamide synthase [Chloroflexi bacterium]|nr:phosphoribosylaminoimidazolesuccinocarboxamide synthase [Chloroflexota bacterium]